MGYIAFIDGNGWTVEFDDDGHPHISKSNLKCTACGDGRVMKSGFCHKCQEIINHGN